MPKAVSKITQQFPLESLEDGVITLRKFNYEEVLRRRGFSKLAGKGSDSGGPEFRVDANELDTQVFEFSHSIMDHNLEDEDGTPLDLTKQRDILKLDAPIAQEIEWLIDELNKPPSEQDKKFLHRAGLESDSA